MPKKESSTEYKFGTLRYYRKRCEEMEEDALRQKLLIASTRAELRSCHEVLGATVHEAVKDRRVI